MMVHPILQACILAFLLTAGCKDALSAETVRQQETTPSSGVLVGSVEQFNAACKAAKPGDVLIWKDGEYKDVSLKFYAMGTAGAPVTLRAQTPGKVVFTGLSSIKLQGSYLVAEGFAFKKLDTSAKNQILTCNKGSSYCRLSDIMIDGSGSKASDIDTKWVNLYGHHNEVSRCTFIDKRNMGCLLVVWMEDGIVPRHTIVNNYFSRPYTHYDDNGKARNGQEAIRIGTSDFSLKEASCTVSGNHFYRCHGERAEIISNKSCFNIYEGNLFEEGEGTLTLRHGNDCIVRGNWFLSGGKTEVGGVRIIGERHLVENNWFLSLTGSGYKSALCVVRGESNAALNGYWTVKDAVVRNNTFVNCLNGIVVNYSGRDTQDSAPENVLFQGNTLVSSKSYMIPVYVVEDTPDDAAAWDGNIISGGKLKNITLDTVKPAPEVPDQGDAMASVRKNAGVTW